MGFGGQQQSAPAAPVYTEPAKPQVQKSQTEAATAARSNQEERAAKAAGVQGSILTSPLTNEQQTQANKTLLGQ